MTKTMEFKSMKYPDPSLKEIARQLEAWQRSTGKHARETELFWAQLLHHKATMALAAAQDRDVGENSNTIA
jgi:hypothetical protein